MKLQVIIQVILIHTLVWAKRLLNLFLKSNYLLIKFLNQLSTQKIKFKRVKVEVKIFSLTSNLEGVEVYYMMKLKK